MFWHFAAPVICLIWLMEHSVDSAFRLSAPQVVTAEEGGSVTVPCQYGSRYEDYTKYWCKGDVYELCEIIVKTPKPRPPSRSSIVDDAGFFNVTMTSLNKSDEGNYWCVIARIGRNVYTRVTVQVKRTVVTTPTHATVTPGQDEITWWAVLRWILFILMLCCLGATHIIVWRINALQKIGQKQKSDQNVNI
ncbi:CMRF35-like molecule 1 [Genypterus blacodes]|uniref:CMRF35-like molecule 1 n=1 Tax=Genypterus blacodes TaxID=154954 RepID=UPI003F7616CC